MNEELKNEIFHIMRSRNHDLITDNASLYITLMKMEQQAIEQDRYIRYLETIINENGWNPAKEKSC